MFQTGLGYSPLACGIATVAIPLAAIGGSITSSALLDRLGRTTMHVGVVVMALGLGVVDLSCARPARSHRLGPGRAAGADRLRDGDGVRPDVRRDPGRRRAASAGLGVGSAGVGAAAGDVARDRRGRHGPVRLARPRLRTGGVRPRRRPWAAGRDRVPRLRGGGGAVAAQARPRAQPGRPRAPRSHGERGHGVPDRRRAMRRGSDLRASPSSGRTTSSRRGAGAASDQGGRGRAGPSAASART